jgi:hypothetical protein
MKNIQGIFSNQIANMTFLPQPIRSDHQSWTVWLAFLQD